MDPIPFDHDPFLTDESAAAQRLDSRDSLFLVAQLRLPGAEPVQVRVRNLSAGGLMAEVAAPLDTNMRVDVEVRGVGWIGGRIAWSSDGRIGIAFDKPIDPMLARKPVGTGAKTPAFVKPIMARKPTFRG